MIRTMLALVLAVSTVAADVAPDPVPRAGEALAPHKTTQIEMSAEVVTITLAPDEAKVHAVFTLKNTSAEAETLEVGFPTAVSPLEYSWSRNKVDVKRWGDATIRDFKAKVDGKDVKAESKYANESKEFWIRGWLCWSMEFAAGQTREVEVSYGIASRDDNYTASSPLRCRQATYILKTGRGWKNAIGSAKVILKFGDITARHLDKAVPEPTTKSADAWTWDWKDWEPDTDILLQYRVFADEKEGAAKLGEHLKAKPEDADALLDLADCQLKLESWKDAAATLKSLAELEARKKGEFTRGRTEWISPWFRAAEAYVKADARDLAKPCAEKAVKAIERMLERWENGDSFYLVKGLHTSKESLLGQLKDAKAWAGLEE